MTKVGRLCERCLQRGKVVPADVVHHKIKITPQNINVPEITLNHENLMALCMPCHVDIHRKHEKRWYIDPEGNVVIKE